MAAWREPLFKVHHIWEKPTMENAEQLCFEALKAAAAAFRLGMEGQASENLVEFIDLLIPLIQDPNYSHREAMNAVLGELLAAQARKDYLHAADLLEYELSRGLIGCEGGNTTHGRK
jgi:hypothetical protein